MALISNQPTFPSTPSVTWAEFLLMFAKAPAFLAVEFYQTTPRSLPSSIPIEEYTLFPDLFPTDLFDFLSLTNKLGSWARLVVSHPLSLPIDQFLIQLLDSKFLIDPATNTKETLLPNCKIILSIRAENESFISQTLLNKSHLGFRE